MPPPKILKISSNPLSPIHPLIPLRGHEFKFSRRQGFSLI